MTPQPQRLKDEGYGLSGRLLDLLFPPRCVSCKQVKGALCSACLATIQPITSPLCKRGVHPLSSPNAACGECQTHPLTIHSIHAALWHEGAQREAIHALKFNRRRDVALPLARFLTNSPALRNLKIDLVTSVPLHPTREMERGYNQAELLAQHFARLTGLPYVRLVRRSRNTADQIGLNGAERRKNVANAFQAHPSRSTGKNVLLIDDVFTTGATLDACAVALFQAGAHTVHGMTIARPRGLA